MAKILGIVEKLYGTYCMLEMDLKVKITNFSGQENVFSCNLHPARFYR
jgi:hypothetical protein